MRDSDRQEAAQVLDDARQLRQQRRQIIRSLADKDGDPDTAQNQQCHCHGRQQRHHDQLGVATGDERHAQQRRQDMHQLKDEQAGEQGREQMKGKNAKQREPHQHPADDMIGKRYRNAVVVFRFRHADFALAPSRHIIVQTSADFQLCYRQRRSALTATAPDAPRVAPASSAIRESGKHRRG